MSMLSLTTRRISISTMAGGGVCGKGDGIAHGAITGVGSTIKGSHPFMEGYREVGGMTTGIIVGEDSHGTTSGYLTSNLNRTGADGKRTTIGRSNRLGVSRGGSPERNQNSSLERSNKNPRKNHDNPARNLK